MEKKEQESMLKLMNELDRKTRRTLLIDKRAFRGFKCITKHKIIECAREHYCNVYVQATSDFILFKDLSSVDLPHPLGPINAVISFSGIAILISFNAWNFP